MKIIQRYAWCFLLGFAFSNAGYNLYDFEYYVWVVPIIFLAEWAMVGEREAAKNDNE